MSGALAVLFLLGVAAAVQLPKFEELVVDHQGEVSLLQHHAGAHRAASPAAAEQPSIGLFTRVQEADLPYVASFFKHYALLGVTRFYLMNSRFEEDHADLMKYINNLELPKPAKFEYLSIDNIMHDDPVRTPGLVDMFKDDYMINVDVDEYWVLPEGVPDLVSLVQSHPADIYYVRWVMVVSDELSPQLSNPYQGNLGFPGKWMARRSLLPEPVPFRMFGHHVVPLKPGSNPTAHGDYQYGMNWSVGQKWNMNFPLFGKPILAVDSFSPGVLVHFWCRSFYDVVLKTQRFNKGQKCTTLSSYTANLAEVPERLKTLAFLTLNTKEPLTVDAGRSLLQTDTDLERSLGNQAACEGSEAENEASIEALRQKYLGYKDHLSQLMAAGAYPPNWPETALSFKSPLGLTVADWLGSLP